jgi:predicted nucleotide-binding protein (sugar kinase/HSP70/actin superfamily)
MNKKPSLTLELDQHTADAGIDTRIEAALDIMRYYLKTRGKKVERKGYVPARLIEGGTPRILSSNGTVYSLFDPRVELILPSMGRYGTEALAAIFRSIGIKARALPVADKDVLLEGRKNTTGKECLPYIVTTGSFLTYLKTR